MKSIVLLILLVTTSSQTFAEVRINSQDYGSRRILIPVPAGNRNDNHSLPDSTVLRSKQISTSFSTKYGRAIQTLRRDGVIQKLRKVASIYEIAPIHILGALVGEHTFNVGIKDDIQGWLVSQVGRIREKSLAFGCGGISLEELFKWPHFRKCSGSSMQFWTCAGNTYAKRFSGKTIDGHTFPARNLTESCFNPLSSGQTYGLGQISPVTALKVSDLTARMGGLQPLDYRDPVAVYTRIMDVEESLHVMAAVIRSCIQAYKEIANFDISKNPGLTATLYNTGNERAKAMSLYSANVVRLSQGLDIQYPEENYYGALINERLDDLLNELGSN